MEQCDDKNDTYCYHGFIIMLNRIIVIQKLLLDPYILYSICTVCLHFTEIRRETQEFNPTSV